MAQVDFLSKSPLQDQTGFVRKSIGRGAAIMLLGTALHSEIGAGIGAIMIATGIAVMHIEKNTLRDLVIQSDRFACMITSSPQSCIEAIRTETRTFGQVEFMHQRIANLETLAKERYPESAITVGA